MFCFLPIKTLWTRANREGWGEQLAPRNQKHARCCPVSPSPSSVFHESVKNNLEVLSVSPLATPPSPGIKPRPSWILSICSTTELQPRFLIYFLWIILFYVYESFVCMCTTYMPGGLRRSEEGIGSSGIGVMMVVSHQWGVEN